MINISSLYVFSVEKIILCGLLIILYIQLFSGKCVSRSRFFKVHVPHEPGFSRSWFFWGPGFSGSRFPLVRVQGAGPVVRNSRLHGRSMKCNSLMSCFTALRQRLRYHPRWLLTNEEYLMNQNRVEYCRRIGHCRISLNMS